MTTKEKLQIKHYYDHYQFDLASIFIENMLKSDSRDPILLYNLAFALYCCAEYSRSLSVMNRILKNSTNDFQILLLAARIYMKCHYYDRAEKILNYIVSGSTVNIEALALLSVYYFLVGDDTRSAMFFEQAKEKDCESPGFLVACARLALYKKKNKAEGDALDMTLTHTTGESHLAAMKTLYYLSKKNKRAAQKVLAPLFPTLPADIQKAFSLIASRKSYL